MDETVLYIPESHEVCTWDNFDWVNYSKLKGVLDTAITVKDGKGVFLYGNPGIGKTHLLIATFRRYVSMGYVVGSDVVYTSWSDLINEVVGVLQAGAIPEHVIDRLCRVPVLIVDDIRPGWGRVWGDVLKRLIEKVYENQVKFYFSGNVEDINDMVTKWLVEDYWLSRLKEMVHFVNMKGQDKRR